MGKKSNYTKIATGELKELHPSNSSLPVLDVEETAAHQEEVLANDEDIFVITLDNGEQLTLPNEFTMSDIYLKKMQRQMSTLLQLINQKACSYSGEKYTLGMMVKDESVLQIAIGEEVILDKIAEFLQKLFNKPAGFYDGQVNQLAGILFFAWCIKYLVKKYGAANSKKA